MEFSQLAQVAGAFIFVIALMLGLSWLFRRFGLEKKWGTTKSVHGLMHIDDTMFLDAKRRLMIVGLESKRYVLLLDGERAELIDTLEGRV